MRALVIFPSVRLSANFGKYAENFARHNQQPDILVIDEEPAHRKKITAQMEKHGGFSVEFFGIEERVAWFGENELGDVDSLIPQRAHNETSFGFLVAATRNYEMIVTVDDDTYPVPNGDFLGEHWSNLTSPLPEYFAPMRYWVNTCSNYYARGFPYRERQKWMQTLVPHGCQQTSVLNMGKWIGIPDLNAMDYITLKPGVIGVKKEPFNFTLHAGQWAPICSMNVAFKPEIISAYYQLWHRDRFDDIFSGLFLKKIASHLGFSISIGRPIVVHEKQPRNLFHDAMTEMPAVELNEDLYNCLSLISLNEKTWLDCYRELATELAAAYSDSKFNDYIFTMTQKMLLWTETIERLRA